MRDRLTPQALRDHAAADRSTFAWSDQAAALLKWAADALEAADQIAAENRISVEIRPFGGADPSDLPSEVL